jgi:hypothetical protein
MKRSTKREVSGGVKTLRAERVKILLIALILSIFCFLPHAAASPSAVTQNDTSFIDELGYYHVVGEVKNTGDMWLQYVRIVGTLKDQNGAVVDSSFTYTQLLLLGPSKVSGFDIVELDTGRAAAVRSYTLAVEWEEAQPPTAALQIVNTSSSIDLLGYLEIVGEVQNSGDSISEYTKVAATCYGADGKVVDVMFTYTDPTSVPAHGSESFKLILISKARSSLVATWFLDAQSNQYVSIPEFAWLGIVAVATVSLGLVGKRKETAHDSAC